MMRFITLLAALALFTANSSLAQLTGTKNIPGDYATLADAVADLNTQGVGAGGVTLLLGANQNLNATVQLGSAALNTGATAATAANPVTIDGAGFTVIGAFAGTRTGGLTASIANDALLVINGTDYVTIRNSIFTQQVSNNTATLAIENAIALHNRNAASPFDGCQNITIQNCTFNMGEVATGGAAIHAAAHVFGGTTALSWGSAAAAPGDMHRDISITNNTFTGYNFVNYFGATTANGRKLFVNNNTMTDIGGAAVAAYGMYGRYIDSCTFNNNTASMSATQSTTNYIAFLGTNAGGYQEALNNNITIQAAVTTSQTAGIYYTSIGADRKMNGNTINFGPFSALTTGTIFGLYGDYSGGNNNVTHEMNSNTCTGQALGGATATTSTIHILRSISSAGTGRKIIMNNNNISNLTRTGGGTLYPLSPSTAQEVEITGNTVSNITWTNNSTSSSANFGGIYQTSTTTVLQNIFNNTITNIHISGSSSSTAGTFNGIRAVASSTSTANNVYGNTINDLGYDAGTNTGTVVGVYVATANSSVYKNKIYTLTSGQAAGTVNGINIVSGTTNNVYNNIISDLQAPAATGTNAVIGINVSGGTTANLSYNTVYPSSGGSLASTGASFGGSGIYISSSVAVNAKNNIINATGTATTGYFAAVKRSGGTAGVNPTNLILSNNIYHAAYIYGEGVTEASATNLYRYNSTATLGTDDPNFNTACGLFKTWKGDVGSFSENNLGGSAGVYQPAGSSFAESGATTATTPAITDDYNSAIRNATTPDMGAIEFSGTLSDASGPAIAYTPIPAQNCNNQPSLSATITDASNVNSNAGTKPRLYYKKHTEANAMAGNTSANNGWKYVEAGNAVSPFTFTIDYSLLTAAPVPGDTIQYFVVAEDLAGTPNVGTNTATYPAGFCPTTVALTAPAFPVTGFRNYVINVSPTVVVKASPLSVCANNNDTLSVDIVLPGNITTGSGTVTSSTYTPYYGSATLARRIQYLVTAAELRALGLRAGNITAISFDIATVPAAFTIADFTLKMGHTALGALTTNFSADATTTVVPAGNYAPVVGNNTHTLSTPFAWDGVSNVLIEACHGIAGTASLTTVRYTSGLPTGISCYSTNAAGCTQPTGTTTTIRPNITLAGQREVNSAFTNFAWNDGSGPVGNNNDTIVVQPAFPSGNSMTYTVTATDASGCSFNGNVVITKNTTTPSGTASADKPTICYGDSVVLSASGFSGCQPYTYSWSDGTNVVGTAASIKASPIANTTYTVTISDNAGQTFSPTGIIVNVNIPTVTGNTPGSSCGPDSVALSATGSAGTTLNWYTAATGGSPIFTGPNFKTPVISNTTNYYVAAGSGFTSSPVGPATATTLGAASSSTIVIGTQYMLFDALSNTTITAVDIYPTAAVGSNFSIVIRNSAGTDIFTTGTLTTTVTGGTTPQTVLLNAAIPAGTGYRLGMGINPGLQRNTTGASYPYTVPGALSFTGNSFDPVYWYFFYNVQVQTGCEGPRTMVTATINPLSGNLAATAGGAQVCQTANVSTGKTYYNNTGCDLIARVVPAGAVPVTGSINTCVKIDGTVQTFNGEPYVQRHYDIEPATNAANATATVTLYFRDQEFVDFNTVRGIYPALPTVAGGGNTDPNIANLRVTQYHGTGTAPGNYTGPAELIDPVDANIVWNATSNWWEVSFPVIGFSGFYIHTGANPIPVKIEYFRGSKQGSNNLLNWKVVPVNTNSGKMELQHSTDSRSFATVYSQTATATQMQQPFSYTDARALSGVNYYRLKLTDDNGVVNYSAIVALINSGKSLELVSIAPNPVAGDFVKLNITTAQAGKMELVISDAQGRMVQRETISLAAGFTTHAVQVGKLAAGVYQVYGISADGKTQALRLVKQ